MQKTELLELYCAVSCTTDVHIVNDRQSRWYEQYVTDDSC